MMLKQPYLGVVISDAVVSSMGPAISLQRLLLQQCVSLTSGM